MKRTHVLLAVVAILAVLWWMRSTPPAEPPNGTEIGAAEPVAVEPRGPVATAPTAGAPPHEPVLRPPNPSQRFIDFTPEKRVEFARRGYGPGG